MTDYTPMYAKSTPKCHPKPDAAPALAPRSNIATKCWHSAADANRKNSSLSAPQTLQPLRLRHDGPRPMLNRFRRCLLGANASDKAGRKRPLELARVYAYSCCAGKGAITAVTGVQPFRNLCTAAIQDG